MTAQRERRYQKSPIPEVPQRTYNPGDILLSDGQIQDRLAVVGGEIARDYAGRGLLVVGILNGAAHTTSDLGRAIHRAGGVDTQLDFIAAGSYGDGQTSSGKLHVTKDMSIDPAGRHTLLVDDVYDSGLTIDELTTHLEERRAASVEVFVLYEKDRSRNPSFSPPQYVGFRGGDYWLQGYGLDTKGQGRNDPHIRVGPYGYRDKTVEAKIK